MRITGGPYHGTATVDTVTGMILYTPTSGYAGADTIRYRVKNALGTYSSLGAVNITVIPYAAVQGRYVFYNDSSFDGDSWLPSAADDAAIAANKQALLPGQTATSTNYTNYVNGINGVIIDVLNFKTTPTLDNIDQLFNFQNRQRQLRRFLGRPRRNRLPLRFVPERGVGGSDRITLVWQDGAIVNQWLQVTMLANLYTGLTSADTFYFGNLAGDADGSGIVDTADETACRTYKTLFTAAGVTNAYDLNRDRKVNGADDIIARVRVGASLTIIDIPVSAPANLLQSASLVASSPTVSTSNDVSEVTPAISI